MTTWFATPPCSPMKVATNSPTLLELKGPVAMQRVAGGMTAAFGAGIAAFAAGFLRAPIPAPFKLIPLAVGAAGGAVSAAGAFAAISNSSVRIEAGRGITFRWTPGPLAAREVVVKSSEVASLEVLHQVETRSGGESFGGATYSEDVFRLTLVTLDGRALPIERFSTQMQATLRKKQIESLLAKPRRKPPVKAPARKARPPPKPGR